VWRGPSGRWNVLDQEARADGQSGAQDFEDSAEQGWLRVNFCRRAADTPQRKDDNDGIPDWIGKHQSIRSNTAR
jgi:hypothetical protein